jgi:glycosyltransferase involved in cell wall biosynthesis
VTDVGVVVLSYNRPRLLAEALASIRGAVQVVIVDDGSDFDPARVARAVGIRASVIRNPKISVDERMTVARTGALVNRGVARLTTDVVAYLCDDDVFAPCWLYDVRDAFTEHPDYHMVRGEWHILGTERTAFTGADGWTLTTGNFAHRLSCATEEGTVWNEGTIAVHDAAFLTNYLAAHAMPHGGATVPCVGMAGWRREHECNLISVTNGQRFGSSAAALLQRQWLEESA